MCAYVDFIRYDDDDDGGGGGDECGDVMIMALMVMRIFIDID